jgi:hypothetical protein
MKVYINKYRNHWLSPYTIMGGVLFYKKWTDPKFDLYADENNSYTNWLEKPCQYLNKVLDVVHPKINYVKIDRWDTWSMDYTLAFIILPMLRQLKKDKHGSPIIDDEDVPSGLGMRSTEAEPKENEWDTDSNYIKRWEWVIDEMIFAFECKSDPTGWEEKFYSGVHDTTMVKIERQFPNPETGEMESCYKMVNGPNHTWKADYEGMKAQQARISNGFCLFGKYYEALWD